MKFYISNMFIRESNLYYIVEGGYVINLKSGLLYFSLCEENEQLIY